MPKFQGVDYFEIDTLLSDEELLVRNTVREFVDDRVLPVIEQHNRAGTFPMPIVPLMAELGLFGSTLPAEYGCAGMNNVAYGLVMQELERGDSGIRSFASVQSALVMYPIFTYGSDEQKDALAPPPRQRGEDRLLRPHRTRLRLESRRNDHARGRNAPTVTS